MGNIDTVQDFINEMRSFGLNKDTIEIANTLEDILSEREVDKKRIKELEEALLKVKEKNIKLFINSKNSIPVQKVKDKIKYYKKLQNNYIKKYDEVNDTLQGMINVLKEIVEDK